MTVPFWLFAAAIAGNLVCVLFIVGLVVRWRAAGRPNKSENDPWRVDP